MIPYVPREERGALGLVLGFLSALCLCCVWCALSPGGDARQRVGGWVYGAGFGGGAALCALMWLRSLWEDAADGRAKK